MDMFAWGLLVNMYQCCRQFKHVFSKEDNFLSCKLLFQCFALCMFYLYHDDDVI